MPAAESPAHATDFNPHALEAFLDALAERARAAGVFASVQREPARLIGVAAGAAEPAAYRVEPEGGRLWIALVMADRWLSESIESDLMHTGDSLEELLHDELVDHEYPGPTPDVEHFRSADRLFTFRSTLPVQPGTLGRPETLDAAARVVLAFEACFRQLGDMSGDRE